MFVISTSYDSFILRELDSSWYVEPSTGGGVVEMGIMFAKNDYNTIMLWWIIDALSLARFGKFLKKCSIIDALCVLSLFVRFLFCFREKVSLPHSTCLNVTLGDLRGTNKGPVHLFEVYTLVSFRDKIYVRTWKGDYKVFSVTGTALFGFFFLL